MEHDERVAVVVLPRQQRLGLDLVGPPDEGVQLALDVVLDVLAFPRQFEQGLQVGNPPSQLFLFLKRPPQPLALLKDRLTLVRMVPEGGIGDLLFDLV